MNHARFITGTGTDVGKTIVSSLLALRLRANYFKPVQSGSPTDSDFMRTVLGPECVYDEVYRLNKPLSPNQAAVDDGVVITLDRFNIDKKQAEGHLLVEGAGGILSPINDRHTMLDVMMHLQLKTIVVARSGLGTITHTLQTIAILRQHGIELSSVILFGPPHPRNRDDISERGFIKTFAMDEIKYLNWEDV